MGEKETADSERKSGSIISADKQAPEKKDEPRADVQDNSPNAESALRQGDTAKNAIQNMR